MKQLKKHIRQIILENINTGNNPSWLLGQYPFPFEQKSKYKKHHPEAESEEDTQIESTLRHFLDHHFNRNLPLPQDQLEIIIRMIQEGQYPDIFKLYKSGKAYRGMVIPKSEFESQFGDYPPKPQWYKAPLDWLSGVAKKTLDNSKTYTPSKRSKDDFYISQAANPNLHIDSKASSWSKSLSAAKSFAKIKAEKSELPPEELVGVILIADSDNPDNIFIDMDPIYEYFNFASHYAWEKELISLGSIQYDSIAWRYNQ